MTKGASSLSFLITTALGTFATLGFANLSRYLVVENSLQQAVRTTARCLSPTDPSCITTKAPQGSSSYRYYRTTTVHGGDTYGELWDYSARMFQERWGAELPYFVLPLKHEPTYSFETVQLPLATFEEIQPARRFFSRTTYHGNVALQRATPAPHFFPEFDESFERANESRPLASQGRQEQFVPILRGRFSHTFSSPGTGDAFDTLENREAIALSTIIGNDTTARRCATNSICSAASYATQGAAPSSNDFLSKRYLALYVEMRIDSVRGAPSVGIQGPNDADGFIIALPSGQRGLGGRAMEVARGEQHLNLWLRGPKNSHGGGVPGEHSAIEVRPTDSIRTRVSIHYRGRSGDSVTGAVTVYALTDRYTTILEKKPQSVVCPETPIPYGMSGQSVAPALAACSPPERFSPERSETAIISTAEICPSVTTPYLWPSGAEPSLTTWKAAAKSISYTIPLCAASDTPPVASKCGFKKTTEKMLSEPLGHSSALTCPLASNRTQQTLTCSGSTLPTSKCRADTLTQASCPNVQREMEHRAKLQEQYEVSGRALTFLDLSAQFRRIDGLEVPASKQCTTLDPLGIDASSCLSTQFASVVSKTTYQTISGSLDKEGTDWTATNTDNPVCLNQGVHNLHLLESPTPIEISGFPFDGKSEIEIRSAIPVFVGSELICKEESSTHTLEALLREYAALQGYPEARNPNLRFEFNALNLGTKRLVNRQLGCEHSEISKSSTCHRLATEVTGTCNQTVELGVFQQPPPGCDLGKNCFRTPEGSFFEQSEFTEAEAFTRAEQVGQEILRRYLPDNRATLRITRPTEELVRVEAEHQLELIWPLDLLLAKKTLPLKRVAEERMEIIR